MKDFIALIATFSGIVAVLTQVTPGMQSSVQPSEGRTSDGATREQNLKSRGDYLVHHVAMCVECHSPRDSDGDIDPQRLLTGAPMPVSSPFPNQEWAVRAPSLRGLPSGWTEDALREFLQTGETPSAYPVQPPMPPFRLNERDARSVVAYLASLEEQL